MSSSFSLTVLWSCVLANECRGLILSAFDETVEIEVITATVRCVIMIFLRLGDLSALDEYTDVVLLADK